MWPWPGWPTARWPSATWLHAGRRQPRGSRPSPWGKRRKGCEGGDDDFGGGDER